MSSLLQYGIEELRSGNKEEARKLFISFVRENPQSEPGWKWMYKASSTHHERILCLQHILRINPSNKKAKQLLDQFLAVSSRTQTPRHEINRIDILAVGAFAGAFILGVCIVLVTLGTQVFSKNNQAGDGCFFLYKNGARLCYPSQKVSRQAGVDFAVQALPTYSTETPIPSTTPTATFPLTVTPEQTFTSTPNASPTSQVTRTLPVLPRVGQRLPVDWRKWPVVPELSPHAQQVLLDAAGNHNLDPRTFSKVGDCQMVAGIFLAGYVNGNYSIPDGMQDTVQWFRESMLADNLTAVNGFGVSTVLDPAFGRQAGYPQCLENETPLDCELRTRRPLIVMIGMGTNWIPNAEVSFEKYLRQIVDRVLETGALPILATKADNVEGDWQLNKVIAEVAYDYDLPLVNVWLSVQELPNHGLEKPPRQVYLTGDGWMKRNHAWLATLENVRKFISEP
jgi:hypothetical protein